MGKGRFMLVYIDVLMKVNGNEDSIVFSFISLIKKVVVR